MLCDLRTERGDHYTNLSFISLRFSLGQTNRGLYQGSSWKPFTVQKYCLLCWGEGATLRWGGDESVQEAAWKAIMVLHQKGVKGEDWRKAVSINVASSSKMDISVFAITTPPPPSHTPCCEQVWPDFDGGAGGGGWRSLLIKPPHRAVAQGQKVLNYLALSPVKTSQRGMRWGSRTGRRWYVTGTPGETDSKGEWVGHVWVGVSVRSRRQNEEK